MTDPSGTPLLRVQTAMASSRVRQVIDAVDLTNYPPFVVVYYIVSSTRLSHSAALILKALSLGYRFGLEIMEVTGLPSGTVYPALRRFERDALVESSWESDAEANDNQRPARRYYQVTEAGKAAAQAATERFPLLSHLVVERPS